MALLSLKGVKKSYFLGETVVEALKGVTFDIEKGEFTAVVGASGSGKSTLLNMMGCMDVPDSGEITLEGKSIVKLSENEKSRLRNKKMGFVFQSFNLIPVLSVEENVALPLEVQREVGAKETSERVRKALRDVGLENFVRHRPDQLSGGQRQRVAIARALICNPSLVFADEPTANLDSQTAGKILELMMELNEKRGVTFLFSTHDERLMSRVTRKIHIKDGMIQKD